MPTKFFKNFFILLLIVATTAFGSVGRITALSGNISIERGAKKQKATPNFQLEEKDTVVSGVGATAQIVFNDNTIITVGSNTNLKIEEYLFDEKTPNARFRVGEGAFKAITGRIGKIAPDKFKLETKTATIGIRGTAFVGNVDKNGILTIACTRGAISVTPIIFDARPVIVGQGYFTRADARGVESPRTFTPQDIKSIEKPLMNDRKVQNEVVENVILDNSANTTQQIAQTQEVVADTNIVINSAAVNDKIGEMTNKPINTKAVLTTASPWSYTVIPSSDPQLTTNALRVTYNGSTKYFKYTQNTNTYGTDETFDSISELVGKLQDFTGSDVKFYLDPTTNKISYMPISGASSFSLAKVNSGDFLGFTNTSLVQTGDMISTTHRAATTTLSDGKVFSYGGFDGSNHLAISQIYNPSTGVWSAATNTNTPLLGEGVGIVPLANGGAMLAGGWSSGPHYETWFWNNASGWTQGTNMLNSGDFTPTSPTYVDVADQVLAKAGGKIYSIAKNSYVQYYDTSDASWHWFDQQTNTPQFSGHSGVALSGSYADKILVFGGNSAATYLFDPSLGNVSNAWSSKASMLATSTFGSSVLLGDGNVLSIGGIGLDALQIYNPTTDTWSYKTPLPFSFAFGSAAAINNGTSVLLAGGQQNGVYSASSYVYTPSVDNTSRQTGSMQYSRVGLRLTKLADGRVVALGGFNYSPVNYDVLQPEIYTPSTGTWTTMATAGGAWSPRMSAGVTTLNNGKILVAGGNDGWGAKFSAVDLYDALTNTWTTQTALPTNRYGLGLVTLQDGRALAIGGNDGSNILSSVLLFNTTAGGMGSWTSAPSMNTARESLAAVVLQDGRVLAMGGFTAWPTATNVVEMFDLTANSGLGGWSYKASMLSPRGSLSAVTLNDGTVLAIGGETASGSTTVALKSMEQYNPTTDSWQYKVPLPFTYTGGGAVTLNDGSVLIVGGKQNNNTSASSWIYNPNSTLTSSSAILATDYNAGVNDGFFIGSTNNMGSNVVGNINSMLFSTESSAAGLSIDAKSGQLRGALGSLSGVTNGATFEFSNYVAPSTTMVNYIGEDNKIIWGQTLINDKAGTIGFASLPDKVDSNNALSNVNDFSSWGYWEAAANDSSEYYSGYWVSGQPTTASYVQQMINQNQTYNYSGHVIGDTLNANSVKDSIILDSNNKLNMTVNFGSANPIAVNSLSFRTSQGWNYNQSTNLTSSSALTGASYSATIGNSVNVTDSLSVQGKFYGPQANSTGGVFSGQLTGTDATQRLVQGVLKATR